MLGNVGLSFRTEHLSIGTLLNDYLLILFQGSVAREILKVTFLLLVFFLKCQGVLLWNNESENNYFLSPSVHS